MSGAASTDPSQFQLPSWAQVTGKRLAHIARVTALLETWAEEMQLEDGERAAWRDAGLWHDALRDAPDHELRTLVPDERYPTQMLHGPAAAARLEEQGEQRAEVLSAVRWHTVGAPEWERVGRALYMADFLEPGRSFARRDRAFVAAHVHRDFDGAFRQVVRMRLTWSLTEGNLLYPETVAMWNLVR